MIVSTPSSATERSFEPGRIFANEFDFQAQLDTWFDERANGRVHETLKARPIDRLREERQIVAPLPQVAPDTDGLAAAALTAPLREEGVNLQRRKGSIFDWP